MSPPDVSPQGERDALKASLKNYREVDELAPEMVDRAIMYLSEAYAKAAWEIPRNAISGGKFTREYITECAMKVKMNSSPGFPLCTAPYNFTTNEAVFEAYGMDGVVDMVENALEGHYNGTIDISPIRLFIKREPHKKKKAVEKRWRLIMSLPLVDQIIDTLLWKPSLDAEIQNWCDIPSKPGFSFTKGDANAMLTGSHGFKDGATFLEMDKGNWDMTVQGIYHLYDVRWRMERLQQKTRVESGAAAVWEKLMRIRAYVHAMAPFSTSDGVVFNRLRPGLLPSGMKNTLSFNAFMQVFLRVCFELSQPRDSEFGVAEGSFVGFSEPKQFYYSDFIYYLCTGRRVMFAQGDDTLEWVNDRLVWDPAATEEMGFESNLSLYQRFLVSRGHIPQEVVMGPLEDLSFCHHSWKAVRFQGYHVWVFVPTNWDKHDWQLGHAERGKDVFVERLDSLCIEYAFHEKFDDLYSALVQNAPADTKVRPKTWYKAQHMPID